MKGLLRLSLTPASIIVLLILLLPTTSFADSAYSADAVDLTAAALGNIHLARLAEPLVATAPTTLRENVALSRALGAYERRKDPDDVTSLAAFVTQYPHSGWSPAIWTNLGLHYLHDGFYSRALDAWQRAWDEGNGATEPHARALVDRAVGELVRLEASLGHFDRVSAILAEIGDRPVTGPATEALQVASEEASIAVKDPAHLFLCGPRALMLLMLAQGAKADQVSFLQWYHAGPNGTNLAEVGGLADEARLPHRFVFRKVGQPVPVPSVVHWKVGHFAAIVGMSNGRYHVEDPVFPGEGIWVTAAALDAEASGYFLVPDDVGTHPAWREVKVAEASSVWGKGPTGGTQIGGVGPQQDPQANSSCGGGGMCGYNIGESSVSVTLMDNPVGYTPPIGPSAKVSITYNQREDSQPANFNFFNVSPKWTLNWLTYVTDDPTNPGANVSRYLPGGGAYYYTGYQSSTGTFAAQNNDGSILVLTSQTPATYQRRLGDGSIEIYAQSNGSTSYPRNVFLSQIIDPQGNTLTLNYDNQLRLTSLTDATGRQTTFTYGFSGQPLLVTAIADPFGRTATFTYDSNGRLSSITDVLGLTSSFSYDSNSLVNVLTTPYGTTTFAYTPPGTTSPPRFVQATDPLGYSEREEWLEPAPIPDSDPASTVPQGMPLPLTNQFLSYRDSFHWDKNQYVAAGCAPTGGCDYTKARDTHFNHVASNTSLKSTSIESVKNPLENRVWYNYAAQSGGNIEGVYEQPIATGRVLDDGTTQLRLFSYDTSGYFKLTQVTDPIGRVTTLAYPNHVDLAAINQNTANSTQTTIAQFTYDTHHRPLVYTDAASQTTRYTYNAFEQLTSATNPLGQATQYVYDSSHNLTSVIDANNVTTATFTYDSFDRIATYTDSEGWSVAYGYDNANRITKVSFPDGTTDVVTYNNLDRASFQDRQGRVWTYTYDADRRLTAVTDPLGNKVQLGYNGVGELTSLSDPKTNTTTWTYDVEDRLIGKKFADNSTVSYTYESTTRRLKLMLDALGQTKQFSYAEDDKTTAVSYLNAVNSTPSVTFTYDAYFPRLVSITDGNGTTQYTYTPAGVPGALQLQQEASSLSNSTITYSYDALGRPISRAVGGAGLETFQYDAIGRLSSHTSDVGSFSLTFLGETPQIARRQLLPISSGLSTSWAYLPNSGDRRLAAINNAGLSSSQYSNYQYTTTSENFITAITETSDAATLYPTVATQTATYNNLNQLTNLTGQALSYDANGNLLSDGQRNYSWDAENRLVGITYPAQPGKSTGFSYDGFGRRTAIGSTPAGGGSTTTTSYLWCGENLCQARNATNSVVREYYQEGEFVPGSSNQSYYYGVDQLGSVRRAFASGSSAPAYGYDPYGNALQSGAPLTDFGFAGMFLNADSGLYLTQYRAYDPTVGRWLSRDPIGEFKDPAVNLYRYVAGNPIVLTDPRGLQSPVGAIVGGGLLGGADLINQLIQNGGNIGCVNGGELAAAIVLGAILGGAPELAPLLEEGAEVGEIAGGAQSAIAAEALGDQLLAEEAASLFTAEGELTDEALNSATQIMTRSELGNPAIPADVNKFATPTWPSPSGDFRVHFYMNPLTREPYYQLDYKVVFRKVIGE